MKVSTMVVVVAACFSAAVPSSAAAEETRPRTAFELREAVNRLMAAEMRATTTADRAAVLRDMVALSKEIAAHPSLGKHAAASLRDRLGVRLKRAARELAARADEQASGEPTAKRGVDARAKLHGPPVPTVNAPMDGGIVAQQLGGEPLAAQANLDGGEALAEAIQDTVSPESWERKGGMGVIVLFGQRGGGNGLLAQMPAQANNAGRRGGPAPLALTADASGELVDLIQQVVAPQSWDVNGGPGAIVFFAPKHALIVRQTGEVHEALVDVVQQLRRNP